MSGEGSNVTPVGVPSPSEVSPNSSEFGSETPQVLPNTGVEIAENFNQNIIQNPEMTIDEAMVNLASDSSFASAEYAPLLISQKAASGNVNRENQPSSTAQSADVSLSDQSSLEPAIKVEETSSKTKAEQSIDGQKLQELIDKYAFLNADPIAKEAA